jgi:hypothetical protein
MITQTPAAPITDVDIAAANKDGAVTVPSLRTLGSGAQQACAGDDGRLGNARTPTAHTHPVADITGLLPSREKLTAPRTYYVSTTGNDTNNGLSAGTTFATIQKAVDVASSLDNGGFSITIQVVDTGSLTTYTGAVTLKSFVGSGTITIQGNSTTPSNVLINTAGTAFTATSVLGVYSVKDLKITTSAGHGLYSSNGSILQFGNINFGSVAGCHIATAGAGKITCLSSYTVSGGAGQHYLVTGQGYIEVFGVTVTITGTPAFAPFAYADTMGFLLAVSITFSGAATGTRYTANTNSLISTSGSGATYFPGNVAGTNDATGVYA